jgi:hypothetical protein
VRNKPYKYGVHFGLDTLKQYQEWNWQFFAPTFDKPNRFPFAIEVAYKLSAANIPDLITGTLIIHIDNE